MDVDLEQAFASVANDPSPEFAERLMTMVAGSGSSRMKEATGEGARPADVFELVTDEPTSRRWPRVGAFVGAAALVVGGLVIVRDRRDSTPAVPPTVVSTAVSSTTPVATNLPAPSTSIPVVPTVAAPTSTEPVAATATAEPPITTTSLAVGATNGSWQRLPDSGLSARWNPIVLALGERVIVVGGRNRSDINGPASMTDGAILEVKADAWRPTALAPVAMGGEMPAVWTGTQLLVMTSMAELIDYNPTSDRWRSLGAVPLSPRPFAVTAWTDSKMLVWGGYSPRGPGDDPGAALTPLRNGATYDPATGVWRALPPAGGPPAGASLWTGTDLVVAPWAQDQTGAPIRAYSPVTDRWRSLPTFPFYAPSALLVDGPRLVAFDGYGVGWQLPAGGSAWRRAGNTPSGGQTSVGRAWHVQGHLVVDTGSGGTNGRFFGYRQAGGAWTSFAGPPVLSNDDVAVLTSSGDLIDTDGLSSARLLRLDDHTSDVPACRADQLVTGAAVNPGGWVDISLTNGSNRPCALDGQRSAKVEMRSNGVWHTQPAVPYQSPPGDLRLGGYLPPGAVAWAIVGPQQYSCLGPVDRVRFTVGGSPVQVAVDVKAGCWDLSGFAVGSSTPP